MAVNDRFNGVNGNVAIKAPCRVATTANITLSGLQTIDGVTVVAGDRVLVKDQTTASANGIYEADTSAWSRAKDFNGNRDIVQGTTIPVYGGTVNGGLYYQVTNANPITISTTSLTFDNALASTAGMISLTQGGTVQDAVGWVTPQMFGAVGDGVTDDTAAFAAAIAASKNIRVPAGAYNLTGLTPTSEVVFYGDGYGTDLRFSGPISMVDVRKCGFRNMKITLTAASTTLLSMTKGAGAGCFENYFEDVIFEGSVSLASTIGMAITDSYINTFVNCHWIYFDKCHQFNTEANRNNFFGCTIRSSLAYGTVLVEANAGQANSYTGCDLENCNRILDMNGGSVFFGEGCYFEAHNSAFGFELAGGHVGISRSYFNEVFLRLKSGGSLELSRNWIKGTSLSNANSPLIRTLSGFSRIILDNNILEGATYLARFDPTVFNYLQVYDEGASTWGGAYPTTEHISVSDHIYDVTSAAITHCTISNTRAVRNRAQQYTEGRMRHDGGSNGFQLLSSAWNYNPLRLGSYYLWVDGTGVLRIKSSAPSSATDGTIVGTQT